MSRLLVVGGGRMGRALVGGLLRTGWLEPGDVTIAERYEAAREELAHRFPGVTLTGEPVDCESAVLAVKPGDVPEAARSVAKHEVCRVVSIAAGVRIGELQALVGDRIAVLRAMPNMGALVAAGAAGLAGGPSATEEDYAWAEGVLSAFGVVARVPEHLLDAVTGLSGSGPGYVFVLAEALVEAGVGEGLDREVSRLLANQTILGAARLLTELEETPEQLRAAVTSPGGTTAAGLRALELHGFRAAVIEAVAAATARAREMGLSS